MSPYRFPKGLGRRKRSPVGEKTKRGDSGLGEDVGIDVGLRRVGGGRQASTFILFGSDATPTLHSGPSRSEDMGG